MAMRPKGITFAVLGLLLAGCSNANVYDMTPDQAYAKLFELKHGTPSVIKVKGGREGIYGTQGKSVTWVTDHAHAYYECTAYLTSEGPERTSVNVGCSDTNAPAKFSIAKAVVNQAAGAAIDQIPVTSSLNGVRNRYIELVDSALDDRPFEDTRARSQVMGWPDPPN